MAGTQLGTDLEIGVQTTIDTYIVESYDSGDADVKFVDVFDEDGARVTRIVMQTDAKLTLNLVCKTGAAPETDWPVGAMAVATAFTSFYVDSAVISHIEAAERVTVSLTNIGIT